MENEIIDNVLSLGVLVAESWVIGAATGICIACLFYVLVNQK